MNISINSDFRALGFALVNSFMCDLPAAMTINKIEQKLIKISFILAVFFFWGWGGRHAIWAAAWLC